MQNKNNRNGSNSTQTTHWINAVFRPRTTNKTAKQTNKQSKRIIKERKNRREKNNNNSTHLLQLHEAVGEEATAETTTTTKNKLTFTHMNECNSSKTATHQPNNNCNHIHKFRRDRDGERRERKRTPSERSNKITYKTCIPICIRVISSFVSVLFIMQYAVARLLWCSRSLSMPLLLFLLLFAMIVVGITSFLSFIISDLFFVLYTWLLSWWIETGISIAHNHTLNMYLCSLYSACMHSYQIPLTLHKIYIPNSSSSRLLHWIGLRALLYCKNLHHIHSNCVWIRFVFVLRACNRSPCSTLTSIDNLRRLSLVLVQ